MPADSALKQLRHGLLRLHKALLDWERGSYERLHGRQSGNAMLDALLKDPQFAWLRPLSQLIVGIDEMLEDKIPPEDGDLEAVVAHLRDLTSANESGTPYEQRYYAALQESADVVVAHSELVGLLRKKNN